MKADRPGTEPATCKSQVQRPTAEPPRNTKVKVTWRKNIAGVGRDALVGAGFF